jgi:hypothetical protein
MKPITISFKPGCDNEAQRCLDMFDSLDRKRPRNPRVLATGISENKDRTITVRFDDAIDYLAFMVAIGAAEVKEETSTRYV